MKSIAETMAQVKTYAVMEGEIGPLLEALRPLRSDPHVLFVEPWLEEALDGVPERTAFEIYQVLTAATVPGDLVVAHGVVAMVVAARCHTMRRRAVLAVEAKDAASVKAELAARWRGQPVVPPLGRST